MDFFVLRFESFYFTSRKNPNPRCWTIETTQLSILSQREMINRIDLRRSVRRKKADMTQKEWRMLSCIIHHQKAKRFIRRLRTFQIDIQEEQLIIHSDGRNPCTIKTTGLCSAINVNH